MANPMVTVLIASYNEERYISACLESVLRQSYTSFEVIIVDDGSRDRTIEIVRSFEDPRVKLIESEHVGLARALNLGLYQAKGKYIARLDADDLSYPHRLGIQAEFLELHSDVGVVGALTDDHYAIDDKQYVDTEMILNTYVKVRNKLVINNLLTHSTVMFRRDLIWDCGGYPVGFQWEDYALWLKIRHATNIVILEEKLVSRSIRRDSLSSTVDYQKAVWSNLECLCGEIRRNPFDIALYIGVFVNGLRIIYRWTKRDNNANAS